MAANSTTTLYEDSETGVVRLWKFAENACNDLIAPHLHTEDQHEIFNMIGRRNVITTLASPNINQINSGRVSYINAILIASRGSKNQNPCNNCTTHPNPFKECISLPGYFDGSCASCKWRDHASKCSNNDSVLETDSSYDGNQATDTESDEAGIFPSESIVRHTELEELDIELGEAEDPSIFNMSRTMLADALDLAETPIFPPRTTRSAAAAARLAAAATAATAAVEAEDDGEADGEQE